MDRWINEPIHCSLLFRCKAIILHHRIGEELFTYFLCDLLSFRLAHNVYIQFNEFANPYIPYPLIAQRMRSVFYCLSLRIEDGLSQCYQDF